MIIVNDDNKTYQAIVESLTSAELYSPLDNISIQLLADTIDMYNQIKKDMKGKPFVIEVEGSQGQTKIIQHPANKTLYECMDRIRYLLTELNLTTKSRKDLTNTDSAKDEIENLLDKD